jgi:hypothetical protein
MSGLFVRITWQSSKGIVLMAPYKANPVPVSLLFTAKALLSVVAAVGLACSSGSTHSLGSIACCRAARLSIDHVCYVSLLIILTILSPDHSCLGGWAILAWTVKPAEGFAIHPDGSRQCFRWAQITSGLYP